MGFVGHLLSFREDRFQAPLTVRTEFKRQININLREVDCCSGLRVTELGNHENERLRKVIPQM